MVSNEMEQRNLLEKYLRMCVDDVKTEIAKKKGFKEVYLPVENAVEAALVDDVEIFGVESLSEIVEHLDESKKEIKKIFGSIYINFH